MQIISSKNLKNFWNVNFVYNTIRMILVCSRIYTFHFFLIVCALTNEEKNMEHLANENPS